jgi:hypothetical protein
MIMDKDVPLLVFLISLFSRTGSMHSGWPLTIAMNNKRS